MIDLMLGISIFIMIIFIPAGFGCVYNIFVKGITTELVVFLFISLFLVLIALKLLAIYKKHNKKRKDKYAKDIEMWYESQEINNYASEPIKRKPKQRKPTKFELDLIQERIRIIQESLAIIDTTDNLNTFFSRHEIIMKNAIDLMGAKQNGIIIDLSDDYLVTIERIKSEQGPIVLGKSYLKMKENAEQLKTNKGKLGRYEKYLEMILDYSDNFSGIGYYQEVIAELQNRINELKT